MTNLAGFDLSQVQESESFDVVPAGWYSAYISNSEKKVSQANSNNEYLKLELTIQSGKFANRKVWTNLNLWNSNPKAAEIAQRDLKSICTAVGLGAVQDSAQLHNRPIQVKLAVRSSADYGDQNEVKGYKAVDAVMHSVPALGEAQPAAEPSNTATTPAKKPWQK